LCFIFFIAHAFVYWIWINASPALIFESTYKCLS
jgi:hypothetical protein